MLTLCELGQASIPHFYTRGEPGEPTKPVARYIDMPRPLHELYELAFFQVPSIWKPKLVWSERLQEYGLLLDWAGTPDDVAAYKHLKVMGGAFSSAQFGPTDAFPRHDIVGRDIVGSIFIKSGVRRTELARFLTAINKVAAGEFDFDDDFGREARPRLSTTLNPVDVSDWLSVAKRLHVLRPFGAGIRESMAIKGVCHVAFHHGHVQNLQFDGWTYREATSFAKECFMAAIGIQALEDYYQGNLMKFAKKLKTTLDELLVRDLHKPHHPGIDSEDSELASFWRIYVQQALCVSIFRCWRPVPDTKVRTVCPAFILEV